MAFRGILQAGTTQGEFVNTQDYKYNTVYPYGIPLPSTSKLDPALMAKTSGAVSTADPYLGKLDDNPVQTQFPNLFYPTQLTEQISKMAENCRRADIDNLILSQDANRSIRCGWLYSPPQSSSVPSPKFSQGFLGISDGPFKFLQPSPEPNTEWIWNLEQAREKILTARCSAMKSCESVNSPNFKSCGYCTGIGQGVPVNSRGQPLYPKNARLNCNNGKIIMQSGQCPRDPVIAQELGPDGLTPEGKEPDVCTPRDGRLGRDCILGIIQEGGCSQNGSLYRAVQQSQNNSDYLDSLRSSTAFRTYNDRAPNKLRMLPGLTSKGELLAEVQNLAIEADNQANAAESAVGASSRDLCIRQGEINNWEPCLEIADSARSPFDLGCLQKNFRLLGGQAAGLAYPSEKTLGTIYNKMMTYGQVRAYWAKMKEDMRSKSYSVQKQAMKDFLGIDTGIADLSQTSQARIRTGFGEVGDVGFPHISFGITNKYLYANTQVINNSIDRSVDPTLNANVLYNNIKNGRRYTVQILAKDNKSLTFIVTKAVEIINQTNGIVYAYAFEGIPQNANEKLGNPRQISMTIL